MPIPPPPPEEPVSPATLSTLAGLLRRLYQERMSSLLGRPYKLTTKDKEIKIWDKVAAVCHRMKADAASFLQAQFEETQNKQGPYVNQLTGEHAARCYQTYRTRCRGFEPQSDSSTEPQDLTPPAHVELESAIKSIAEQCLKAAGTCNPLDPKVQAIFFHEYTGIPAILRCALCGDDPEVFRKYGEEARRLLASDPAMQNAMRVVNLPVNEILNYQPNN